MESIQQAPVTRTALESQQQVIGGHDQEPTVGGERASRLQLGLRNEPPHALTGVGIEQLDDPGKDNAQRPVWLKRTAGGVPGALVATPVVGSVKALWLAARNDEGEVRGPADDGAEGAEGRGPTPAPVPG